MWHEVCYFCRFPLLLPKDNIDALSYYPRAILDSFRVRTETEAGRCCPYLFTAATSQLSSIVLSMVDMADDPADNAVFLQLCTNL